LKTIWRLVKKDLLRDSRHPWGLAVFMIIPVLTALLMALVFSPKSDLRENVILHVALLDRDDDFIAGMFRFMSSQGNEKQNLRLHFVDTPEEGIRLLEKRKVSALVVLPENLTADLLDDKAATLDLYKNPAESILPRIAEEGLQIGCIGLSSAINLIRPEIKTFRDLLDREAMPDPAKVGRVASDSVERLKSVEPYLFPPLIQFKTVTGSEYLRELRSSRATNGVSVP